MKVSVSSCSFCDDGRCIIELPTAQLVEPGSRIRVEFEFLVTDSEILMPQSEAITTQAFGQLVNSKVQIAKPIEDLLSNSEILLSERAIQIKETEHARQECHRFTGIGEEIE